MNEATVLNSIPPQYFDFAGHGSADDPKPAEVYREDGVLTPEGERFYVGIFNQLKEELSEFRRQVLEGDEEGAQGYF
ncbi:MAG: hypothetical protein KJ718_01080 [Nanoarchaeota archaeon]|nr:hypothetical protein [Nanoarchaeota archaeon]MBU1051127.1 hypothetical protein [Nanoarchaeota archaeon]MBU1988746.1 hypothetical protein [Nanoarchaeota archaeon]